MNRYSVSLALCFSALTCAATLAADYQPYPELDPPTLRSSYDWSGFHAGLNMTAGIGDIIGTTATTTDDIKLRGAVFGVQAGMNWQTESLVVSLGGKIGYGALSGSTTCANPAFTCEGKINAIASVHARIGASIENYLLYAKAGFAYNHSIVDVKPTYPGYDFGTPGVVLGAGIEMRLSDEISMQLEYSYYAFNHVSAPAGTLAAGATNIDSDVHMIDLGMNYFF